MRIKGFSIGSLLVVLLVVSAVAVVAYFLGKGGFGIGGGKGDGEGTGSVEAVPVIATQAETAVTSEIVTTQEIEYVEVTVHENTYLFNNKPYEHEQLTELINDVKKNGEKVTVRIKDDNASDKAYSSMLSALSDAKIRYIEVSE